MPKKKWKRKKPKSTSRLEYNNTSWNVEYVTCFIIDVNASFGKPKPIAAISATTWKKKKIGYTITLNNMHKKAL